MKLTTHINSKERYRMEEPELDYPDIASAAVKESCVDSFPGK